MKKNDLAEKIMEIFMGGMAVLGLLFVFYGAERKINAENKEIAGVNLTTDKFESEQTFVAPETKAKAVYVYDVALKKPIYEKDAEKQLPLASITKIMTAVVAAENASLDETAKINRKLLPERGGGDAKEGENWNLKNLVDFSLLVSSNDGTRAIASAVGALMGGETETAAEGLFLGKMNEKAAKLGLSQTYFINESGLDINEGVSGAYGSAKDAAALLVYAYDKYPKLLEATGYEKLEIKSLDGISHEAVNSNEAFGRVSGLAVSKTGFTDIAGGNLAVVFEAGPMRPIVVSILGSGKEERFLDLGNIYDAILQYLASEKRNNI